MSKEDLYRYEEEKSLDDIADFLEELADDLRNGELNLFLGSESAELELPETVTLDIDVDRHDKEDVVATSVEIELKWAE